MKINLLLNPDEMEILIDVAKRECRKPEQQARYLLLVALGLRGAEKQKHSASLCPTCGRVLSEDGKEQSA